MSPLLVQAQSGYSPFSNVYVGQRPLRRVIDALEAIGGQCAALYPEKPIYDIPAYPEVSGGELIRQLERQAAPFDPHYHLNQQVIGLSGEAGDFHLNFRKCWG